MPPSVIPNEAAILRPPNEAVILSEAYFSGVEGPAFPSCASAKNSIPDERSRLHRSIPNRGEVIGHLQPVIHAYESSGGQVMRGGIENALAFKAE